MSEFIQIELEKASREDFILNDKPAFGSVFYLKSAQTGDFDGPYLLKNDKHRLDSFKCWLNADMVYIQKRRI